MAAIPAGLIKPKTVVIDPGHGGNDPGAMNRAYGLVESKLTLDHEKRRTINRKLHALLSEEAPYTFLWTLTNYSGHHKKLRRVAIHPYKFFSFADEWFIPVADQK